MTMIARPRRFASLVGLALLAFALAGCTLSSETSLIDPAEGEAIFEEAVVFAAYNDVEGVLTLAENGPPGDFTYANGGYVAPDGSMTAYFLPAPDGGDYMMLVILGQDDAPMYGTARRDRSGITELRLVFDGGLEQHAARLPAGVEFIEGGLRVASRADLDAVIPLIADGTLPTVPMLAYLGGDAPPPTLVPDGDWYRAAN